MKATIYQNHSSDGLMGNIEQMSLVLATLPDPAFLLSRSGKYLAIFGGRDARYYHDGSHLVGLNISEVVNPKKADWFIDTIDQALQSQKLLIVEYELSNHDVKGVPNEGPRQPIWFEARIQALDLIVDDEEVVLWVASNISMRHDLEVKLRELSDRDQLTQLFNRRKLVQDLAQQYEVFSRYSVLTSIFIFDLDNLKLINDTHGHNIGDKAIVTVANSCRSQLRKIDVTYRFGGDEFVVILPGIGLKRAGQVADRLLESFNLELSQFFVEEKSMTVSIGVSTMLSTDKSYETTLKRADCALYKAKRNGKNQVVSD